MSQEFTPGDRVMVSEGYPGVVMDVSVGIDTVHYWVELEDEQGQGWWSENEMTPASLSATASQAQEGLHEAVESYPELGDILTSRPDYVLSLPEEEYQRLRLQGKVASRKESIYLPLDLSPGNRGAAYEAGYSDGYDGMQSQDRGKTAYSSNYLLGWADGIRDRHAPDPLDTTEDLLEQEPNLPEMNFVPDRFDPVHASIKEAALSDIIDFVKGDPTPTDYWAGPGKNWSYDWCRFRRDSTCYFPKELDRPSSELAGYAVWVPHDRGHCRRQSWDSQEVCPMPSQPGPNVPGGFTDATVPWSQGGQRGGVPSRRVASRADIGDGMAFHYIAAWADVQAKGKRIYDDGGVRVLSVIMQPDGIRPEIFVAQVQGDNKVYQVQMDFVPGTFKVGAWECECPWNSYNWGRRVRPDWEGRACSHFMAAMYAMQSQGMSGMPDSEDAIAPEWVPKAASAGPLMAQDFPDVYALLRAGSPVSQVQALMTQSGIETQSTKTHFKGTVNGQVVDLDFEDGNVYYLGEEYLGEVIHPDYHPTRGLVASKSEQEDDMSVSNDEWLFSGPGVSTSELKDEPEPALPITTAEEEPEEDLLGETLSVQATQVEGNRFLDFIDDHNPITTIMWHQNPLAIWRDPVGWWNDGWRKVSPGDKIVVKRLFGREEDEVTFTGITETGGHPLYDGARMIHYVDSEGREGNVMVGKGRDQEQPQVVSASLRAAAAGGAGVQALRECVANGTHLKDVDPSGYCNVCEWAMTEDEFLAKEGWPSRGVEPPSQIFSDEYGQLTDEEVQGGVDLYPDDEDFRAEKKRRLRTAGQEGAWGLYAVHQKSGGHVNLYPRARFATREDAAKVAGVIAAGQRGVPSSVGMAGVKVYPGSTPTTTAEEFLGGDWNRWAKTASAKTAAAFSVAEQNQIINEGEGVTARNLDSLALEGTHYLALEPMLTEPGLDDDTISW